MVSQCIATNICCADNQLVVKIKMDIPNVRLYQYDCQFAPLDRLGILRKLIHKKLCVKNLSAARAMNIQVYKYWYIKVLFTY